MGTIFSKKKNSASSSLDNQIEKPIRKISYTDLDFTDVRISNKEDVTLIWFDENIDKRDDILETKTLLQATNHYALFCADKETCCRAIELIKYEKIILVLAGKCARDILEQVHSYEQLDSIYIFCYRPERYDFLRNQFSKLVYIHKDHAALFCDLNQSICGLRSRLETFTLFDQKKRFRPLPPTSVEFLWFLLLKEALMRSPITPTAKQHMIKHCRNYYHTNPKQLKDIDEFERTYQSNNAIYWYSRSLFVSHLVNKALRTEDIDLLFAFRYFIVDLSENLRLLAIEQSRTKNDILHLQRGLTLSNDEINQLHSNIGNLISPNGFMSTSRCTDVAMIYGVNAIFYIEVDTRLNICADIQQQSAVSDEREIVFNLGSVFRIENVQYDREIHRWIIKIVAISNSDEHIQEVLQLNDTNRPEIFFGELMCLMERYDQAKRYFHCLIQEYSNQEYMSINYKQFMKVKTECDQRIGKLSNKQLINVASIRVLIAKIYQITGNHTKAMAYLQTVLDSLSITT